MFKLQRIQFAVTLPLIVILLFFSTAISIAQESDSLAFGESKAVTLKYLKSISTIEQDKCDKALFFEKFDINLTASREAKALEKIIVKVEPNQQSENCKVAIPEGSIVKLYNYYEEEKYWAVKYTNKWGFIPGSAVKLFD
ncbi:MAG: hypothetical protein K8S16_04950 [Bacteroidales bacterium]|nr:hypothetical protein [Bacteroidales bacterium]